jgi:hypothetical protein
LLAVFVNHANFACANAVVNANKRLSRTFIECDDAPPKVDRGPRAVVLRHRGGLADAP